jgi:hypothetical protein
VRGDFCASRRVLYLGSVDRPGKFEHHRYIGDKRTQVVYDLDTLTEPERIDELMTSEAFLCFGPDTLAEARNRGYRLYKPQRIAAE